MKNEITTARLCVLLRGGLELWINAERAPALHTAISDSSKRFININGQVVNTFEIVGVFTPDAMEDRQRRKNGQWKCEKGRWHDKGQDCQCPTYTETVQAHVEGIGEVTFKR